MKRPDTQLRELRAELRYWQGQAQFEERCLKASRDKCKAVAQKMREVQAVKP